MITRIFLYEYSDCTIEKHLTFNVMEELMKYHIHVVINQKSTKIHDTVHRDNVYLDNHKIFIVYVCDETEILMPVLVCYVNKLLQQLLSVLKEKVFLKSDGKTPISVEYENDEIKYIDMNIVLMQYVANVSQKEIKELDLRKFVYQNTSCYRKFGRNELCLERIATR